MVAGRVTKPALRRAVATSLSLAVLPAALCACATRSMPPPGAQAVNPVERPLKDLSLIREAAPPVLTAAAANPYRSPADCAALAAELASLDAALGADIDKPKVGHGGMGWVEDLINGAINLPFRGVVRFVTGADARDRALRTAVVSGMVRRGYLKGVAEHRTCSQIAANG